MTDWTESVLVRFCGVGGPAEWKDSRTWRGLYEVGRCSLPVTRPCREASGGWLASIRPWGCLRVMHQGFSVDYMPAAASCWWRCCLAGTSKVHCASENRVT